ncbi:MAG TPA: L,D-transpeptidase [Candidatus Saccharimonadales bacterium]|nr:L,D-transpeptidase [Candidatus Saccharimonadales bacterium]
MSRAGTSAVKIGNDFVLPRPKMKVQASVPAMTVSPREEISPSGHVVGGPAELPETPAAHKKTPGNLLDHLHNHSFIVFAVAILFIGALAIQIGGHYWEAKYITVAAKTPAIQTSSKPVAGFNLTVPAADFQTKLQSITNQPVTLSVGQFSEKVDPNIVKGWLQITANKQKTEYYIHVNEAAIGNSLIKEANEYARTPVNQVTVNEDGTNVVAVAGKDGRSLSDPNGLKSQGKEAAKNVLAGNGLQFNTPMQTVAFQAQTPANFSKVLVANVTTKKMWAFQNGQQVNSFLTSDGAPDTPTPLGEFHVYAKFSVQDMSGTNLNGTKYFQPKVPWVSYFYEGSAVHGVYWHPLSWFGNINSSHGCVGLPVDQAQWVYNWDSIGTTVITHA